MSCSMKQKLSLLAGRVLYWLAWPGLAIYLGFKPQARAVVRSKGQVLLVKTWLGDGKWGLPGGTVLPDELAMQAAVRTTMVQTGLQLGPVVPLAAEEYHENGLTLQLQFVVSDMDSPQPPRTGGEGVTAAAWFVAAALPPGTKSEVRRALEIVAEEPDDSAPTLTNQ